MGAVSDSQYQVLTGIFKVQDDFIKKDLVNNTHLPFTNILDKGYCLLLVAWREDRKFVCQPVFAKSNCIFTAEEILFSALFAADRSGNKHTVNVCKHTGFIQRGLTAKGFPIIMANAWLAWSF